MERATIGANDLGSLPMSLGMRLFLVVLTMASANEMVGPGAMTPFSGGGGERETSYGYMDEPAIGFFVGGSSVKEMNGLFDRTQSVDNGNAPKRKAELAYKNELTQWHIALVESSEEEKSRTGKNSEWLLLDNEGRERFMHEGESILPGSGDQWRHLHRHRGGGGGAAKAEGTALQEGASGDDPKELPWQVIAINGEGYNLPTPHPNRPPERERERERAGRRRTSG